MQRDAQIHLLRRFQRQPLPVMDDVAAQHQIQPRVGEQLVPLGADERRRPQKLLPAVGGHDVLPVQPLIRQVTQLAVEVRNAQALLRLCEPPLEGEQHQPRRDLLPVRRVLRGQLHSRLYQRVQRRAGFHAGLDKALRLRAQRGQRIALLGKIALDLHQRAFQFRRARPLRQARPGGAKFRAPLAVEDIALGGVVVPPVHERPLHRVLDVLHMPVAGYGGHALFHAFQQPLQFLRVRRLLPHPEGFFHGLNDLFRGVGLAASVSFDDFRHGQAPCCMRS